MQLLVSNINLNFLKLLQALLKRCYCMERLRKQKTPRHHNPLDRPKIF